ncbi:MAG: hypothetical protein HW386_1203 [Gammaproteobacteria bacterium]|nr:hypothetical protein [Gammaproteobacteria bacterium]
MNIHSYKPKKGDDGTITFPQLQCWNPLTEVATIAAEYRGKRISCRIKVNDLRKKFHYFPDLPMQLVTIYRAEIEGAAKKLIEKNEFLDDGSIIIKYKDL